MVTALTEAARLRISGQGGGDMDEEADLRNKLWRGAASQVVKPQTECDFVLRPAGKREM